MVFALCRFPSFCTCRITYGTVIRLSTYCKVHSHIQLISCCEGVHSYLKERFLHFSNRIISVFGADCMANLYIFHILSYSYIKLYLIQPLPYPFYPPYVSISSPQPLNLFYKPVAREPYCIFAVSICDRIFCFHITLNCCRKSGYARQKEVFSSRIREVPWKERFLHRITEKKHLPLCHTLHHYGSSLDNLRIVLYTHCIYYSGISVLYFSCGAFPISIIFSPSFFGFLSAFLFSISICCGFTPFYHYAALVVPFCTWLCFFLFSFALLM